MPESLNVIALISGGKDSFFSLLHCIQNGHKLIALGNLYPASSLTVAGNPRAEQHGEADSEDEHDLNSFMYQTVGHTVIPLYEQALQIPLYRQPIVGTAVQSSASYNHEGGTNSGVDETESLVPLLERVMANHPTANALSTGAILSTYQRTRVESVSLRLGLTPLSFLWKYPILPPGSQISLLEDMQSVGLDARIVKVASGGLDESFLWENVADPIAMRRIERSMKRFSTDGDGAVLGEGGEFETLVINGPQSLFKGRIEVSEESRVIVREGGGAAWLRIRHAQVVMKDSNESTNSECRIPQLLEPRFSEVLDFLVNDSNDSGSPQSSLNADSTSTSLRTAIQPVTQTAMSNICHWTVSAKGQNPVLSVVEQATELIADIRRLLVENSLKPTDIISTIIILRSMDDFAAVNKIYSALFSEPNPPSRVTISCGDMLPTNTHLIIHLKVSKPDIPSQSSPQMRKALHVQSRSYWAPANIGPYSQAISTLVASTAESQEDEIWTVAVAGQIPLIPHAMSLPATTTNEGGDLLGDFKHQVVLALQHLWRIGQEMDVAWWTSAVAYLPRASADTNTSRAAIAGQAWRYLHRRPIADDDLDDGEGRDLWEEKHYAGMENRGGRRLSKMLPDWDVVKPHGDRGEPIPPFFAVEVEELPRKSGVEWHAHLGVVNGPVELHLIIHGGEWAIYQSSFGGTLQSVVMINYMKSPSSLRKAVDEVFKVLCLETTDERNWHSSYLDVSIQEALEPRLFGCAIPCRSIWDISGKRLGACLILGT